MKNSKLVLWALVDAVGILVYIAMVAFFMSHASETFGQQDKKFIDPIIFLLLFVVSAATTSSLFFGRPIYLYWEGMKKEAVKLLIYTLGFLALILLSVLTIRFFIS
ncbi:MAG: hypothetical protein WAV25_03145 [Minisyncoccia bacterium]